MKKIANESRKILTDTARQLGLGRLLNVRRYIARALRPKGESAQYKLWRKKREKQAKSFIKDYQALAANGTLPTINLVMPAENVAVPLLKACLDSILDQVYRHWQLCVIPGDSEVEQWLKEYTAREWRIEIVTAENGSIVKTTNTLLERVKGGYLALVAPRDLLASHALLRVAEQLIVKPDLALVYADEDTIDTECTRSSPCFKPDWNPDLLMGQNYIGRLAVLKVDLVRKIGGFRESVEGPHEYDLLLRCIPHLGSDNVAHIPDVLYHRRSAKDAEPFSNRDSKNDAGLRAVTEYLRVNHSGAKAVKGQVPDSYRVIWPLPEPLPRVSLLIPTRDGVDLLKPCVDAILAKTDYPNMEVIILDNQSRCARTLAYFDALATDHRVSVHRWDHPFNYSAINNYGATLATGDIIGLVNNDIEPINGDWLREMVSQVIRPDIGCVGAKLYYPDGRIQHAGVILGVGGVAAHSHRFLPGDSAGYCSRLTLVQNLSAVTAACLLVRKSVFNEVGGLDEEHLAVAFNDVDFCLKVREAGYRNLWTPYAQLYHHESATRGAEDTRAKRERFLGEVKTMQQRWGHALSTDPAYNLNLTRQREDFSLEV